MVRLISAGHYLRHLRRLRGRVAEATSQAVADLAAIGLDVARPRDGGFYLWAELPDRYRRGGTVPAGGGAAASSWRRAGCSDPIGRPAPSLRINVAHASDPRFLAFMRKALTD